MLSVKVTSWKPLLFAGLILMVGCRTRSPQKTAQSRYIPRILQARFYDSGFRYADDNYNACFRASNGKIYYVLCSGSVNVGAQMYAYDPATQKISHIGDLTEAAGEKGMHAVPQGKGHSIFVEFNGKLYFATHVGYYNPPTAAGQELEGTPPPGYKPYPGGHFMSYDLTTGQFKSLAKAPVGEGIIAFGMDAKRARLYGITWPSGLFLRYDMHTDELKNFGPISLGGERGIPGKTFRVICRDLAVDPDDGSVYFTIADGKIFQYRYHTDSIENVQGCNLKKDVFGCLSPSVPGTMAYNWRAVLWYPPQKVFYAVHGRSGYLFKFEPRARKIEVLERFVSDATRESGMYDPFAYGHLGFTLGPEGHTIYYLTGAPRRGGVGERLTGKLAREGYKARESGTLWAEELIQHEADQAAPPDEDEDIHFVTYNISSGESRDYGVLQLADGRKPFFVQSIAVGKKNIYAVAKVRNAEGRVRVDLLSFPDPVR
jgi:hypothetical protein